MQDSPRQTPYGTAAEWTNSSHRNGVPASPSLERSSTWARSTAQSLRDLGMRAVHDDFYSRYGHPNARAVEAEVAAVEGGAGAVTFASGMSAIHAVFASFAGHGDRVAVARQVYGGVTSLCRHELPRSGVEVDVFDVFEEAEWDRALEAKPRLCWVETPINPTMRLVDLHRLSERCRAAGVPLACDATFAPAPVQSALRSGADLIVHSLTKYYGGHSDVLGGVVVSSHEHCRVIEGFRARTGAILAPDSAWLVQRSLRTHRIRVEEQNRNAARLARDLAETVSPDGVLTAVHHPSLPSHPDHELARAQMPGGFGAVLTLTLGGGYPAAVEAMERLQLVVRAPSLGGVESLVSIPVDSSHVGLDEEGLRLHGIDPGMLRVSVGLEPFESLRSDLFAALGLDA
ncbi:MAG: PLP-dependent transferase [Planctomycetota bacterium]